MDWTLLAGKITLIDVPWLSIVTWLPLLGAFLLLLIPREQKDILRGTALIISLVAFGLSLGILFNFSLFNRTFQFTEQVEWIPSWGVSYSLGLDGISLFLVVLTTFLQPIVLLSTFKAVEHKAKEFLFLLLFLETGMIGALVSTDLFLFYIFWELMLIPMYLLIGVWGAELRVKAAVKFFLYTMVGSLLMLVGILYVYFRTDIGGAHSFALAAMYQVDLTSTEQMWLFAAFALAFAIKVPLFPFHTWLPLAHVQAPTAGSVVLAGVLLKMGTYGLVRFAMPLFPQAVPVFAPIVGFLAVIGIIYGALLAIAQKDVKKLVAYSSVSHLGFCVLGIMAMTTQGLEGSIFVMLAHGISTGGLFLCVGILYERRHTKKIADYGGIAKTVPIFAFFFMIITLSSAGLPGMNGFIGEFLVLMGTFTSTSLDFAQPFAIFAASGVILGAVYLLWMFQRVMFGPITKPENKEIKDLNPREIIYLTPIILMIFFMGLFPNFFLDRMHPTIELYLSNFGAKQEVVVEVDAGSLEEKSDLQKSMQQQIINDMDSDLSLNIDNESPSVDTIALINSENSNLR